MPLSAPYGQICVCMCTGVHLWIETFSVSSVKKALKEAEDLEMEMRDIKETIKDKETALRAKKAAQVRALIC